LPIADGDAVMPVLNQWIDRAVAGGAIIIASRDWHPAQHVSFDTAGGPWPPHCVQDTPGAHFHPDLRLPASAWTVTKGVRFDKDQYSAFDETGLAGALQRRGVERVWTGGLALDVCVKATALDALRTGFETHLILAASRPVSPQTGMRALQELGRAGVKIET